MTGVLALVRGRSAGTSYLITLTLGYETDGKTVEVYGYGTTATGIYASNFGTRSPTTIAGNNIGGIGLFNAFSLIVHIQGNSSVAPLFNKAEIQNGSGGVIETNLSSTGVSYDGGTGYTGYTFEPPDSDAFTDWDTGGVGATRYVRLYS